MSERGVAKRGAPQTGSIRLFRESHFWIHTPRCRIGIEAVFVDAKIKMAEWWSPYRLREAPCVIDPLALDNERREWTAGLLGGPSGAAAASDYQRGESGDGWLHGIANFAHWLRKRWGF